MTEIPVGIIAAAVYLIIGGASALAAWRTYKPSALALIACTIAWPFFLLTGAGVVKPFVRKKGQSPLVVKWGPDKSEQTTQK